MTSFKLCIITPNGKIFDDHIDALMAPGTSGSFGVLGKHIPMVTSLRNGPLKVKKGGTEHFFAISSGVLEVNEQRDVLLLADCAIKTHSIEGAKSKSIEYN